ncbi:type II secretion system protein GspM [Rhodopila sp.]|uniref:type II secretion system protein GspM n=1 Tax=Rhodopila sp. TaxID=2480087 RepID=UPI003D14F099
MIPNAWLSGRRGQALAVGIGLVALTVVWFGIIDPALSWFSGRQALLQQRQELLLHMRDLAATLPSLRTAAAADRHDGSGMAATTMLPGDSDAVAAADLQERVQKMAADAGASLTAVETLPPAPAATSWHKVTLRISLSASWPVLMTLLRAIEQSPTRILIDDVRFRSPTIVAHPLVLPIQASMVLYGFRPATPGAGT